MTSRQLHDGRQDGLEPLASLNLAEVETFSDLLRAMSSTAFSGRQLGNAFDVLLQMARDPECQVVLTLSGAMTVAKQGRLLCDLVDRGIVQAVVATGALIAHGLTESIGCVHYRHDPQDSDEKLYQQGYNRIYDTLEMEANLNDIEQMVRSVLANEKPADGVWSSARLCSALGKRLAETTEEPGILKSAFQNDVPVFIPAFTDSEIGLDVSTWAMAEYIAETGKDVKQLERDEILTATPAFNPFIDLQQYARSIGQASKIGIFTIGGGVPRNWAQQVAPYHEILNERLGTDWPTPRFQYGVRICPEPVHWGGLSGCTYSEGISWGKFVPPREGGRFAEVYADATVVLPLLLKAIFEQLDANK